ncbi:MAG: peptidoglycan-associated lipoprotein Pal [Epsilonproteobacteria bacterium]|nr:MAG: peptidoglycan-associated lipoprotein Pal [Campylobacterota bacterium]RLA64394.1 MAG: peptidoglycan-associated lipoprotein Pal [Campylobacterota bacterium]
MLINGKKITGFIILIALFNLFGCSSTKRSGEPVATKDDYVMEANGDSDSGTAGPLKTVFFAFDSSVLRGEAQEALDANIEYLQEHHQMELEIEGHCDERGSAQYNLALGERRARVVYDYMVANGVDSLKLNFISYGKEKPVSFGHNRESWSQNRRANFVVKKLR